MTPTKQPIQQFRRHYLPGVLLLFLVACNRGGDQQGVVRDSGIGTVADSNRSVIDDAHYFWEADLSGKNMVMKKSRTASPDSLNVSAVLGMLNSEYPELRLEIQQTRGDTVFIKVGNGRQLSHRMGSTGAEGVLAEITYNLTEISGIQYVNLDFKQGDHATPGTYARTDFVNP